MSLFKPSPLPDYCSPLIAKISVGARLHFGLLAFDSDEAAFGGVGAMIDRPGLEVQASEADTFNAVGPLADRIEEFAQMWQRSTAYELPAVRLATRGALEDHVGLGCGTQLGLAVATLLSKLADFPLPDLETLARTVDRAKRSAIGCYGFLQGGFLFETGHRAYHFPQLEYRGELPADWRFVLAIQRDVHGKHGSEEEAGFQQLERVPQPTTSRLRELVVQAMIPALEAADIERFGEAVYQYGALAGDCYSALQGGRYANPACTEVVQRMRSFGIAGVGQSSWGPTIFGLCDNVAEAEALSAGLRERYSEHEMTLEISEPNHGGAHLEWAQPGG
ncbi:hypothetical protein DTL21_07700 [Bremerella cremea]|uniref:GHMP kinase C-terminal domain-containing protein n=1 Tax=Blastopirellula marina TaxID=124 RepID=A0A2S8G0H6_9BACT|nr:MULTISPECIES: hypothetical protein [Pirellulaceae]PQO37820.1 hypothetical protein C5Y83_07700 [Blastopirellula marina]RCS50207.1 hypothetical protein DTL21_07700 [Bremerella cremea]